MAMVEVRLKKIYHKSGEFLGFFFNHDAGLNNWLRGLPGCRWSKTNSCWLLPVQTAGIPELIRQLGERASLNYDGLPEDMVSGLKIQKVRKVREDKQQIKPGSSPSGLSETILKDRNKGIHPVNAHVLPAMAEQIALKAYSRSTGKTYLNEMAQYLRTLGAHPADGISVELIRRYFVYCHEKLKLSENTLHSRINALKFYYEQVRGGDRFYWDIPRPKKPLQLPKLLNESELAKLFNAISNRKHKAMLFMAYSAGLRVSELVNLKLVDIDSQRMQIFVSRSKGKKDRYINLSPLLLEILRDYVKHYSPRPREYLFESDQTRGPYPARTVQQLFTNAKRKAGISKKVGIHSLRHSFATHLLDKGTDIKFIKELLGHHNIKTTERYLHVTRRQIGNVESPFDELWRSGNLSW